MDESEKQKLQTAYANFLTKLDEAESGWPLHPFFRTAGTVILGMLTLKGLSLLGININPLPILATIPQRIQKRRDMADPKKRGEDKEEARKNLGLSDIQQQTILDIQRDLRNPQLDRTTRDALLSTLKRLERK